MRLVVTGREGQVARSLIEQGASAGVDVATLGRPELDLAGASDAIFTALKGAGADVIVSAGAYTQVDQAESETEQAFAINEKGARAVAEAARRLGIPLIHLSTDYVFDGTRAIPYTEDDAPAPTGVYGASKQAGEQAVLSANPNGAVVRTAWVYSPFGNNFVKTMLRVAAQSEEVSVVDDQRGNPTSALDIADGILRVAANLRRDNNPAKRGIFHMTGAGEATWADFAEEIFRQSSAAGGPSAKVKRISSAEYPRAAKRPPNSRLDSSKLARVHGVRLPDWRTSLKEVVSRLQRGA